MAHPPLPFAVEAVQQDGCYMKQQTYKAFYRHAESGQIVIAGRRRAGAAVGSRPALFLTTENDEQDIQTHKTAPKTMVKRKSKCEAKASPALPCPPVMLGARDAARACGMSLSLWYSANCRGLTPQSSTINTKRLWDYQLLKLWSLHGCPSRDSAEWQSLLAKLRA